MSGVAADYKMHEAAYRKLRERGASGWDAPAVYEELWSVIARYLPPPPVKSKSRALELGCGAGNITTRLHELGFAASGVDIAPTAIEWARERAATSGHSIDYRVGDVCDLRELADRSFDVVLDGHCLHCIIGPDRERCLGAVARVLRPGGRFLCSTMCGDVTAPALADRFDRVSRCVMSGSTAIRYVGEPTALLKEIETSGFVIERWEVIPKKSVDDMDDLFAVAVRTNGDRNDLPGAST